MLASAKVDVHQTNAQGNSLLHLAVSRPSSGDEDRGTLIQLLLESGASPAAQNLQGDTPLAKAVRQGSVSIVQTLLKAPSATQASLASRNKQGYSALHEAAIWGHSSIVKALLDTSFIDIDTVDDAGNTALMLAGDRKRVGAIVNTDPLAAVSTLLDNGASVSVRNQKGQTALHLADCSIEYLQLLLDKIAAKDSPIFKIQDARGHAPIVSHLRERRPFHAELLINFVDHSILPPLRAILELSTINPLSSLIDIDAADALRRIVGGSRADLAADLSSFISQATDSSSLGCLCLLQAEWGVPLPPNFVERCMQARDDSGQTILHKAARRNRSDGTAFRCLAVFEQS